jgi:hypothetical protein
MEVLTHGVTHVLRPDILELLIGLAVLVTLLVLAGLILQVIGSARDARRFPPPGQLVDVGGHRLHIYCMGGGHASGRYVSSITYEPNSRWVIGQLAQPGSWSRNNLPLARQPRALRPSGQ